jgi:hypothetical protein
MPDNIYAGLSNEQVTAPGYGESAGMMQKVGNFLPGLVGLKDIDYPFGSMVVNIVNGKAVMERGTTLDEGNQGDYDALGEMAVARINDILQANGVYGQKDFTLRGKNALVLGGASGRHSGGESGKLGKGLFIGGGSLDGDVDFNNGASYTNLESVQDFGQAIDQFMSKQLGSEITRQDGSTWTPDVQEVTLPDWSTTGAQLQGKLGSYDNTNAIARMVLNAAAVAATGYGLSQLGTMGAGAGGLSPAGTFANAPGIGFSNTALAGDMTLGSTGLTAAGGTALGAPSIATAASGALGMGEATWAGLSSAGGNVGFAGVPDLGYIDTFNLGTAGNNVAGTNQALGGTAGNLGAPGINEATTNVVDNAISGVGPNSSNVINNIPGSNPAPPGSGTSAWDKLTAAGKKFFTDPDGTVNWTRVTKAGLLGSSVLGGVLGSVPDQAGTGGTGGILEPYVAPDWVTGELPTAPDPGEYMKRGGQWKMGETPGQQANLLAKGKAPPQNYTANNYNHRMTVDPSMNTLPMRDLSLPTLPQSQQMQEYLQRMAKQQNNPGGY